MFTVNDTQRQPVAMLKILQRDVLSLQMADTCPQSLAAVQNRVYHTGHPTSEMGKDSAGRPTTVGRPLGSSDA